MVLAHPEAFAVGKSQRFKAVGAVIEITSSQERSHLSRIEFGDGCIAKRADGILFIIIFDSDHWCLLYFPFKSLLFLILQWNTSGTSLLFNNPYPGKDCAFETTRPKNRMNLCPTADRIKLF